MSRPTSDRRGRGPTDDHTVPTEVSSLTEAEGVESPEGRDRWLKTVH